AEPAPRRRDRGARARPGGHGGLRRGPGRLAAGRDGRPRNRRAGARARPGRGHHGRLARGGLPCRHEGQPRGAAHRAGVLVSTAPGTPVLELRRATFGYAGTPVVRDLTLRVSPGEVVALLGPNGSGKSTVVRGVLGLAEHLGGEVRILGEPIEDFHERHRVGYVPQRHTLSEIGRAHV